MNAVSFVVVMGLAFVAGCESSTNLIRPAPSAPGFEGIGGAVPQPSFGFWILRSRSG